MVRWIWFLTGCGGVLTPETEVAADEPANPPPYTTNGEPGPEFQDVYGERVTLTGRYLVEQGAGDFRAPQVATLQADDGRTFITSYSADPKYYPLVDLKVVVTGRPYEPSMMKRSMYGHHFEIESMGLAAGETPHPTDKPYRPPVFRSIESGWNGQWIYLLGNWDGKEYRSNGEAVGFVSPTSLAGVASGEVTLLVHIPDVGAKEPPRVEAVCPGLDVKCGIK